MFKKVKKIIFVFVILVFFVFSLTISVSAQTVNTVVDLDVAKIQIKYDTNNGVNTTPWYTLNPYSLYSPYGGIFQAVRMNDDTQVVSNAIIWNMNTYFTNLKFKKNVEYRFKGYFVLPWNKIYDVGYCNVGALVLKLCDMTSNRNVRYEVNTSIATSLSSWTKKSVTSTLTADFGFYPFDFTFTPSSDFTGFLNSYVTFGLADPPNSGGYFGFSDLTLSYEVDNTQQIIDNQNKNTQDIIDNQNANADKEIQAEQDLYEQEKQEAQQSGEESIDGALENMPNDSEGIIDSFGSFIGTMLHTNTDCSIDFPELKTPAIGGLPSYTLSEKQPVNFNEFEELIPNSIMLIVRALLTIALIIFCYKELYSTIQYVVSLKKGGGD